MFTLSSSFKAAPLRLRILSVALTVLFLQQLYYYHRLAFGARSSRLPHHQHKTPEPDPPGSSSTPHTPHGPATLTAPHGQQQQHQQASLTSGGTAPGRPTAAWAAYQPPCDPDTLARLNDTFVIFRTGAQDALEKVPLHLATTLRCVPHYGLWSDLNETIAGHDVADALDDVDAQLRATHPDFAYYRELRARGRAAFKPEDVARWAAAVNTESGRDSPGWKLDKWKFLPLAAKAFRDHPRAKWYVFVEPDSYLLWRNVVDWLARFDPTKPWYLGVQMRIGDIVFAYGGAGIIISNAAMRTLNKHRDTNLEYYDSYTANHWAGDCVLGKALLDSGTPLRWTWPNMCPENPGTMDFADSFGGSPKKLWCHYAASYHHLPSSEVTKLWDFEQKWQRENTSLLRHRDVFRYYVLPRLDNPGDTPHRAGWDNLSDREQALPNANSSTALDCRRVCEHQPDCLQYSFHGHKCRTSAVVRVGHAWGDDKKVFVDADNNKQPRVRARRAGGDAAPMVAGWMLDRIRAWADKMDGDCGEGQWILPWT